MGGCQGDIKKKWGLFRGPIFKKTNRLIHQVIQHRLHLEVSSDRPFTQKRREGLLGLSPQRFGCDSLIMKVDIGREIQGGGQDGVLVKSKIIRAPSNSLIQVEFPLNRMPMPFRPECKPQPEVPFTNHARVIPMTFEKPCQGQAIWAHQGWAVTVEHSPLEGTSPGIASGQQTISCWRADSRRGMSIGKTHPLGSKTVQMRRWKG